MSIGSVEHDRGLVAYRVQGGGPVDILHLPGWVASIDLIDEEPHIARFDRRLAAMGRLIDFDLPGVGLSDGDGNEFEGEQMAAVCTRVLDAVASERAVVIAQGAPNRRSSRVEPEGAPPHPRAPDAQPWRAGDGNRTRVLSLGS